MKKQGTRKKGDVKDQRGKELGTLRLSERLTAITHLHRVRVQEGEGGEKERERRGSGSNPESDQSYCFSIVKMSK